MGSTRIIIPDRPGASGQIAIVEAAIQDRGDRYDLRPLTDEWVIAIQGSGSNDAIADFYANVLYLLLDDDAHLDRLP